MNVKIRPETAADDNAIHTVHAAAFPTMAEGDLVRNLWADSDARISLVAVDVDKVIGHVMLSRMDVQADGRAYRGLGLAPVAVLPELQRKGIGTALIEDGLHRARLEADIVFVLGEPDFYRRFGFSTEVAMRFASPYSGPYFMACILGEQLPAFGRADYAPAFARMG